MSFKYSYKKKSIYTRKRRRSNENVRIKDNLNRSLRRFIKGKKVPSFEPLIQCNFEFFKSYIESMFNDGMDWSNYGIEWHLDHIVPCSKFNLTCAEERSKCYHFSNLQPLSKQENLKKSFKCELITKSPISCQIITSQSNGLQI